MLTRFYADNFRSFTNFELRPAKATLLLGENGSGKTSVLDALWALRSVARGGEEVAQALPPLSRTAWERRNAQRFELEVQGNGGMYLYTLEIEHAEPGPLTPSSIRSETVTLDGKHLFRFADSTVQLFNDDNSPGPSFPFGARRSFLSSLEPSAANQRLTWFLTWLDRIWIFKLDPAWILQSWFARTEAQVLNKTGDNFAAFYRHLVQERPDMASALEGDLRSLLPGFQQLRLASVGDARGLMVKFKQEQGKEFELSFFMLSDGQLILVVLYTLLHAMVDRASLLCIDEPDNFVALPEIQPWLLRLSETVSDGGNQALLVSHHPEVTDYLAADSAFRLERPGGGFTRVSAVSVDRESGLKLSEIIARGWDTGNAQ